MALNQQLTGMFGVYLTAAELTDRGFIVSPTSRSAIGADLLVTDQLCQRAWSVQVKTERVVGPSFWLNKHAKKMVSPSHVYVFVRIKGKERPTYYVVPSEHVGSHVDHYQAKTKKQSAFYTVKVAAVLAYKEKWDIFGDPAPQEETPP
jgi:hypothetical protein